MNFLKTATIEEQQNIEVKWRLSRGNVKDFHTLDDDEEPTPKAFLVVEENPEKKSTEIPEKLFKPNRATQNCKKAFNKLEISSKQARKTLTQNSTKLKTSPKRAQSKLKTSSQTQNELSVKTISKQAQNFLEITSKQDHA